MFFVATAAPDAHVNVSPRGLDTFRVLEPKRVAWLDLTGSAVETIAHLWAEGRITLMFCAFEGLPKILRLYGRGEVREPCEAGYDELRARLLTSAERKGPEKMAEYRALKNTRSIDGLPGLDPERPESAQKRTPTLQG